MSKVEDMGFKELDNPYYITCWNCGREILRTTNIPTKSCHCGAKMVFRCIHEGCLNVWDDERAM